MLFSKVLATVKTECLDITEFLLKVVFYTYIHHLLHYGTVFETRGPQVPTVFSVFCMYDKSIIALHYVCERDNSGVQKKQTEKVIVRINLLILCLRKGK